jgi:dihydrofolate reductase
MSFTFPGGQPGMTSTICNITVSIDGFVAGPHQSRDVPLGEGGESLHEWMFATAAWRSAIGEEGGETGVDSAITEEIRTGRGAGAYIMGRNMFAGPGPGPWEESWRGWWGEEPPYHAPVFVLTHHPREPLPMRGGTTFHFVTDGIEAALERAREAAGPDRNVAIAGGASTVNQFLAAGLLDELYLHVAPQVLGGGERLFTDVGHPTLEPVEVHASPAVTHIRYRVGR